MSCYVLCPCGSEHWGPHGAAGLLLVDRRRTGVVLQLRAAGVHEGGTWSVPGGAIDPGETPVDAALREAHEESGISAAAVTVLGTLPGFEHPEWTYTYVLAETHRPWASDLPGGNGEAVVTRWVDLGRVTELPLHPAFAEVWPRLHRALS